MGSIINPITYRSGYSQYWASIWSHSFFTNTKYSFCINQDINLILYFEYILIHCVPSYIVLSSTKFIRSYNMIFIIFQYYSPVQEWSCDEEDFLNWEKKTIRTPSIRKKFNLGYQLKKFRFDLINFDLKKLQLFWNLLILKLNSSYSNINQFRSIFLQCYSIVYMNRFFFNFQQIMRYTLFSKSVPCSFIFKKWNIYDMTACNLAYFLRDKFKNFSTVNQVLRSLNTVIKELYSHQAISGYKFMYKGRFKRLGRRGRATYKWSQIGGLPLSTISANISYFSIRVRLKYSTCGLKVWLFHKTNFSFNQLNTNFFINKEKK